MGGWGVGVFDRDFTKSLIIRDFDDVLKNPFRSFPITFIKILKKSKNTMHDF